MATKKTPRAEPPEPESSVRRTTSEAPVCANCGQPAVFRTTNPGASTTYYCRQGGQKTYRDTPWLLAEL